MKRQKQENTNQKNGMKKRQMDYVFAGVMIVLMAVIVLISLVGCKTKERVVTEYTIIHDTVSVVKTDTVRDIRVQIVRDTLKQVENHVLTINEMGDTIKEEHRYHDILRTVVVDSTNRYQARVDSLRRALEKEQSKNTVVKKSIKMPWWMWMAAILVFLVGLHFIVRFIMCKR